MAPSRTRKPADDLRGLIRERGLRATAPRIAVLSALARHGKPATHAEISTEVAGDGWDRATVYRNLVDLTDAGLARRVDMGDHLWRFEVAFERDAQHGTEHPHFLCDACGDVACLPADAVKVETSLRAPRALRKRDFQIQIKGRCDRCAA